MAVTRYVNTDSTAGGNGTTNDTTGADRAFASLNEARVSLEGSNFNDNLNILFCGSAIDTNSSRINWSVDSYVTAGKVVTLKANKNVPTGFHGGRWNTNTYRFFSTADDISLFFDNNNTSGRIWVIDGLQFYNNKAQEVILLYGAASGYSFMNNCIIRNTISSSSCVGVETYGYNGYVLLSNTVVCGSGLGTGILNYRWCEWFNCLVCNYGVGYGQSGWQPGVVENCVSFNNTDDFTVAGDHIHYCASDDGDGDHAVSGLTWANQFVNPNYLTDVDFRVRSSCNLTNAGLGPVGSNVPSTCMGSALRHGSQTTIGPYHYTGYKSRFSPTGLGTQSGL